MSQASTESQLAKFDPESLATVLQAVATARSADEARPLLALAEAKAEEAMGVMPPGDVAELLSAYRQAAALSESILEAARARVIALGPDCPEDLQATVSETETAQSSGE